MLGTSAVTVLDSVDQAHVIHFNIAGRTNVYLDIDLTVSGAFNRTDGLTDVSDALIAYIGGVDSTGTFHTGLVPGADVVYQKLVALAMGITGVTDAVVKVGTAPSPTGTANIPIDANKIAETKAGYISVETV